MIAKTCCPKKYDHLYCPYITYTKEIGNSEAAENEAQDLGSGAEFQVIVKVMNLLNNWISLINF